MCPDASHFIYQYCQNACFHLSQQYAQFIYQRVELVFHAQQVFGLNVLYSLKYTRF